MSPDLIVFGEDWGAHQSATQHLVRHLAADRQVIWVNSIGLRRPRLTFGDGCRMVSKIGAMMRGSAATKVPSGPQPETLRVVSPIAISWPGSPIAQAFNQRALSRQIRQAMAVKGIKKPILWTSLPTVALSKGSLQERALVYYCGDDFGSLAGVDHGPVRKMERALAERADLIFVASEKLAERFPSEKTILLPHGVDIELFSRPAQRPLDLPRGRPIAGFYGSISEWFDIDLMVRTARELDNWQFVLVGPVRTDVAKLRAEPNICLLGEKAHSDLPSYLQHWDVALLPFLQSPQIMACNPLKLREYLASGTPIVSTRFPALEPYRDLIEIADAPASFGAAILRAAKDTPRNHARVARVSRETWAGRTVEVAAALDAL